MHSKASSICCASLLKSQLLRRSPFYSFKVRYTSTIAGKSDLSKSGLGSESIHPVRLEVNQNSPVDGSNTGSVELAPFIINGDWTMMHPVYTPEEVKSVQVARHQVSGFSDWFALTCVRIMRGGFDLITGYKHVDLPKNVTPEQVNAMSVEELRRRGVILSEDAWLTRFLVLESIAGVPGHVAAMARHLKSLRLGKRDGGWLHTLLEEAENERMHLLTFMTLRKPGIFYRMTVLLAQGVFWNVFCLCYFISPRTAHRLVGFLEEEAVLTYTRAIRELEAGHLPAWKDMPSPEIARQYWKLPDDSTLLDVLYAVRMDEATHRMVNHSLASLNQNEDFNPFALGEPDALTRGSHPGFSRQESLEFAKKVADAVSKETKK